MLSFGWEGEAVCALLCFRQTGLAGCRYPIAVGAGQCTRNGVGDGYLVVQYGYMKSQRMCRGSLLFLSGLYNGWMKGGVCLSNALICTYIISVTSIKYSSVGLAGSHS